MDTEEGILSGILLEGLAMPRGLRIAPATHHGCVTNLLRLLRDFAYSYFGDVFGHSLDFNSRRILKSTDVTSERPLNLYAIVNFMPTSRIVYFLLAKNVLGSW